MKIKSFFNCYIDPNHRFKFRRTSIQIQLNANLKVSNKNSLQFDNLIGIKTWTALSFIDFYIKKNETQTCGIV